METDHRASTAHRLPSRRYLHVEIDELTSALLTLGALVDDALTRVVAAVIDRDPAAAVAVTQGDAAINRLHVRIRQQSFHILLTQSPVACDLRNVLATAQMATELERIGDHCAVIGYKTLGICALSNDLPLRQRSGVGLLGTLCIRQVRDILGSVLRRDSVDARRVAAADDAVDAAYHAFVDEVILALRAEPSTAPLQTNLLFVAHSLERIGDRVTNIAEEIVYVASGQMTELG